MKNINTGKTNILRPAVAGRFYPDNPDELRGDIHRYIEEAQIEATNEPVFAVLTPHAGYPFSGPVAGYSFRFVQNQTPNTIMFIALAHRGVEGGSVFNGDYYQTPLGDIPVDKDLADALLAEGNPIHDDPSAYFGEHSVEVNLPFVQEVFPEASVVSMLTSHCEPELCKTLGEKITRAIQSQKGKKVLVMISSDMSHYPPYEDANRVDRALLKSLETLEPHTIFADLKRLTSEPVDNLHCVMCGSGAMLTAVEAARAFGANKAKTLHYQNSGDCMLGDRDRVVGYGSFAVFSPTGE